MIHIVLRDVIESDLPVFFEQQLDPEATAMAAFPSREREAFMTHWHKSVKNETAVLKTILFDEKIAGNIVSWEPEENERDIGYWIGKEYWGKGIATQALAEFLKIVKTRPLYAYVARHNVASARVLQKCGFAIYAENLEEFTMKLDLGSKT